MQVYVNWFNAPTRAEAAGPHLLSPLYIIFEKGHGRWGTSLDTEREQVHCFFEEGKQGESLELQADQLNHGSGKMTEQLILEIISHHIRDKILIKQLQY